MFVCESFRKLKPLDFCCYVNSLLTCFVFGDSERDGFILSVNTGDFNKYSRLIVSEALSRIERNVHLCSVMGSTH